MQTTLEQNTTEWLKWRHQGIGGSDCPIIMGVSPYKKRFELWEEKIRPEPVISETNYAMEKGNKLEPIAREMANLELGLNFQPRLLEHPEHAFMKCSLDGLDEMVKVFCEIKYCGKNFFEEIPEKYYPQVQYQCFMTGMNGHYIQINDEKQIHIMDIKPDIEYIKEKLLPEIFNFWKMVTTKEYNIDPALKTSLEKYAKMKKLSDLIEEKLDALKKSIYVMSGPKLNYGLFNISTVNKTGEIDYKKIVEEKLPELDLEPYRKKGTSYQQIKISKPKKSK